MNLLKKGVSRISLRLGRKDPSTAQHLNSSTAQHLKSSTPPLMDSLKKLYGSLKQFSSSAFKAAGKDITYIRKLPSLLPWKLPPESRLALMGKGKELAKFFPLAVLLVLPGGSLLLGPLLYFVPSAWPVYFPPPEGTDMAKHSQALQILSPLIPPELTTPDKLKNVWVIGTTQHLNTSTAQLHFNQLSPQQLIAIFDLLDAHLVKGNYFISRCLALPQEISKAYRVHILQETLPEDSTPQQLNTSTPQQLNTSTPQQLTPWQHLLCLFYRAQLWVHLKYRLNWEDQVLLESGTLNLTNWDKEFLDDLNRKRGFSGLSPWLSDVGMNWELRIWLAVQRAEANRQNKIHT